jgi:hypothetical protein
LKPKSLLAKETVSGSFEKIPGRAKALHAKAQSREGHKENKEVILRDLCVLFPYHH